VRLADIADMLPPEGVQLMALLEAIGTALETSDDISVTDLGWDFRAKQAEMTIESNGRRLEMILREKSDG
jgi:hypothetical protein